MLNLLRENNASNENYSLQALSKSISSFEECLLELNDSIHETYINDYLYNLRKNIADRVLYKSIFESLDYTEAAVSKNTDSSVKSSPTRELKFVPNSVTSAISTTRDDKQAGKNKESAFRRIINAIKNFNNKIAEFFRNRFSKAQNITIQAREVEKQISGNIPENHNNTTATNTDTDGTNNSPTPSSNSNTADKTAVSKSKSQKTNRSPRNKTSANKPSDINAHNISSILTTDAEYTIFYFPKANELTPDVYNVINHSIKDIVFKKIKNIDPSKDRNTVLTEIKKNVLHTLYKALPRYKTSGSEFSTIDDYKHYIDNAIGTRKITCTGNDYIQKYHEMCKNPIALSATEYTKKLKELNNNLDYAAGTYSIYSEENKEIIMLALVFIKDIAQLTSQLINQSIQKYIEACSYFIKVFGGSTKVKTESGFIHGEPFDSETLFANADYRDFNPTEWMNLELTTEMYEIKYAIREFKKNVAIKEANILLNNTDPRKTMIELIAMREAEEKKFKLNIDTIIFRISEMISKFLGTVKDTFNQDSILIKKNAEKMKQPFTFEKVSSKGDIIAGIDRVQIHLNIRYDEATMKDDTKKDIFEKQVLPSLSESTGVNIKRKNSWDPSKMEIAEYCKRYFGGPISESSDGFTLCEYTGKELDGLKDKITNFIHNFNKITASINSDLNSLKIESKKLGVKDINTTTSTANSTTTSQNIEPQNNSVYYSILYDRALNEADIVKADTEEKTDANVSNNNLDNDKAVNGANEYFNCYKDVIAAKLTAIEFIHSELMQIIRNHLGIKPTPEKGKDDNKK